MSEKLRRQLIANVDMDDTLFDYKGQLTKDLEKLRRPHEPLFEFFPGVHMPDYIIKRIRGITATSGWWANLPKFQLGWDIWSLLGEMDFSREILTKANLKNPNMWKGKIECIVKNIGYNFPATVTSSEKGRHYGNVLMDDWQNYMLNWLAHRPRGLGIMPAHPYNKDFKHPQVVRYDGTNLEEVRNRLIELKRRYT